MNSSIRDSPMQGTPARGLRARLRRMVHVDDSALLWLRLWRALAVLVLLSGFASVARAQSCRVEALELAFGTYDPVGTHQGAPLDSYSAVRVNCTANNVAVTMGIAAGGSGEPYDRRMRNPFGGLRYNVYLDPARTRPYLPLGQPAGNATCLTRPGNQPPPCSGGNEQVDIMVYGRVPGGQDPGAGPHEDSLIVEISF